MSDSGERIGGWVPRRGTRPPEAPSPAMPPSVATPPPPTPPTAPAPPTPAPSPTAAGADHPHAAELEQVKETLQNASFTASSDDHTVSVTVGPGNAVLAIDLTQQALRLDGATLGRTIVEAYTTANAGLTEQLAAALPGRADLAGSDGPPDPAALMDTLAFPDMSALDQLDDLLPDDLDELVDDQEMPGEWRDDPRLRGLDSDLGPLNDLLRMAEKAEQMVQAYDQLREGAHDTTATARTPDDTIAATVRTGGVLERLEIDDAAGRKGAEQLSRALVSTIHQATAKSAGRMAEQAQELLGDSLDLRAMVSTYGPQDAEDTEDNKDDAPKTT